MFLVLASILLGYHTLLCDASVITLRPAPAAAENTNMKSINVLKEHLRRNNDDYKASLDRRPNNKAPIETVPEEIDKNTGNELQNRRGLDLGIGEIIDSVFNFTTTMAKTKKLLKVTQKSEPSPTKEKSESSRYPKYVNKEKADKASKSRVKYSQSPKQLHPSVSTSLPPIPPPAPRPALRAALAMAPDSQESASTAEEKVEGVHMRADLTQNLDSSDEIARVPNPYELDMAPAKGGRVQDLRSKNRLCFRHVMIPEGPKYDSKGAVYLREYEPVDERDYPATRAPSVLLPRCCNCCRKSVLGCE